jgi:hypothetical protein
VPAARVSHPSPLPPPAGSPSALGAQALEQLPDRRGQALVRGDLGHPCRVAASGRDLEQGQNGDGGRLVLV